MVRVAPGADLAARRGAGAGPARGHFPPLRLRQWLPTRVLVPLAAVPDRREPRPGGGGALLGRHEVRAARTQRNYRCGGDSGTGATAPAGLVGGFDVGLGLAAESLVVAGHGSGENATRNSCSAVLPGEEPDSHCVGEVAPAPGAATGEADGTAGCVGRSPGPARRVIWLPHLYRSEEHTSEL